MTQPEEYDCVIIGGGSAGMTAAIYLARYHKRVGLIDAGDDTKVFERAGMLGTPITQMKKDDPAKVARAGCDAMMAGREQYTYGFINKAQAAAAEVLPAGLVAELQRKISKPKE